MLLNRNPISWSVLLSAALLAGCTPQHPKATAPPAAVPAPPPGRLVSAVVAGFEHGTGSWKAESRGLKVQPGVMIGTGNASRGHSFLAARVANSGRGDLTLDMFVDAQRLDWSRFGNALRADVRCKPDGSVHSRLYVVGPDGKEVQGPEIDAHQTWTTLVWPAGSALTDLTRLGIRWRIHGRWSGELGVDNVRVGAAAGLNQAWSVAVGPFPSREEAVMRIGTLKAAGVDSFPIYAEGWYLNVGTFSSRTAATAELHRLAVAGTKAVLIQR